MDAETKISEELARRSNECERDILAMRADGRAAFCITAPNSVLWAWMPLPPPYPVFDLWLN